MSQLQQRVFLAGLICLFAVASDVEAQSTDPLRFVRWTIEDVLSIPRTSATLKSGLTLGVVAGGVLAASHYDRNISRQAQSFSNSTPQRIRKIFHEAGNVDIIRPISAIIFVGALTSSDTYFQDASFTSLESIILANLLTNGLKLMFGRARPNTDSGPASLVPFSGNRSFPSGHASTIFASTTPWLLYYPGIFTGVLFCFGVGVAAVRVADEYHWFSDVLGGALIGFGTGYLLSRRHQRLARAPNLVVSMKGISITWSI
ncbi:MAG: phosphatase PAP2 family protein [Bacteroidetes bacterium]|nr:phosphatase PAP2 family protein [Bacteroidota bacterium]MCY4205367.1 phosphatase PAP2 family protein [Bacteroidota bacterium]